jgi:hypothetical protein
MDDDGQDSRGEAVRPQRTLRRWAREAFFHFGATGNERFWSTLAIDPETGCRPWMGSRNRKGYGHVNLYMHRLAWELVNGPVPSSLLVLHRCDNPPCCNPDHLFLGTHADNAADRTRKGRSRNRHTGPLVRPRLR